MINNGPVQIGTNIEHVDGIDNRHLTIVNPVQPEEQQQTAPPASVVVSSVRLSGKKSKKLQFFRVVKALCDEGFFVDTTGAKANDKDVFEALAAAFGDNFTDYTQHLSEGLNHNSPDERAKIFSVLEEAYRDYEEDLKEKKKNR